MPRLALYLLSPPRIERDGTLIQIRRRKAVALLAYLAMTASSHSREKLATLLWPESDRSRAFANLRVVLAALHNALGEGWLYVDRENVSLDLPTVSGQELWLDVAEFRDRLAACRMHDHSPEELCPACLSSLTEAVDLYGDDFLAGFTLPDSPTYDEWQFFQTEGMRQQLATALERLVRGHSDQGAYESAIPYARRRVSLDPLHEPAHRALMQLYARSGQRAAALRQYAECERVLREELGVAPEEETTRIYQAIQKKQVTPPPAPAPGDRHDLSPAEPSPSGALSPDKSGVPAIGALLNDRYRLDAEIGRGGMGRSPTNLPAQRTPFVGRQAQLAEVRALLARPEVRLLTLTGAGGGRARRAWPSRSPPDCGRPSRTGPFSSPWRRSATRLWYCLRWPRRSGCASLQGVHRSRPCSAFCGTSMCCL